MPQFFIRISITVSSSAAADELIARLGAWPFNGFEETQNTVHGYLPAELDDQKGIGNLLNELGLNYTRELVEEKNWNEEWEQNFQPVQVEEFCVVRAPFHPKRDGVKYDVVIMPKMSFGTGHHATTWLMISEMSKLDLRGKKLLDFGTGTGILAILAEKMGAASVLAIDNDDWSVNNAHENLAENQCSRISVEKRDEISSTGKFDVVLANINKHVILAQLRHIKQHLELRGVLLLSGLLKGDADAIQAEATQNGLEIKRLAEREGWICLIVEVTAQNNLEMNQQLS